MGRNSYDEWENRNKPTNRGVQGLINQFGGGRMSPNGIQQEAEMIMRQFSLSKEMLIMKGDHLAKFELFATAGIMAAEEIIYTAKDPSRGAKVPPLTFNNYTLLTRA